MLNKIVQTEAPTQNTNTLKLNSLVKELVKLGQLTKSAEHLILKYLQEKSIKLPVNEYQSLKLRAVYELSSYKELVHLIRICTNVSYLDLHFNLNYTTEQPLYCTNYPTVKFIDTVGELYRKSIYSNNTSVINRKDRLTIVIGNSLQGLLDTVSILSDIKELSRYSILNISVGHIDPKLKLNNFSGEQIIEFLSLFINELSKSINTNRKVINLTKLCLKTFCLDNTYKLFLVNKLSTEYNTEPRQTVEKVKTSILNGYVYNSTSMLFKLNNDILDSRYRKSILETTRVDRKIEILKQAWADRQCLNKGILLPNNALVLTKSGPKSVDKLGGSVVNIWNGTEWVYATVNLIKNNIPQNVYLVCLEDGNCFEIYEDSLICLNNGTIVNVKELKKGDIISTLDYPPNYNYEEYYTPTSGVVSQVIYDHYEEEVYCLKVGDTFTDKDLILANSVLVKADVQQLNTDVDDNYFPTELNYRIAYNYLQENHVLAKNTVILDSIVDLSKCSINNLDDYTNVFRVASIITSSALKHPIQREVEKLNTTLTNYPVVNVELTNVYSFIKNIKNYIKKDISNNTFYCVIDLPKAREHKQHFITVCESNCETNYEVLTSDSVLFKSSIKQKLANKLLSILMAYARLIIEDTINKYCAKHALKVPNIVSSVKDTNIPKESLTIEEQYELIKILNTNYATHNVHIPIYYKKSNLEYIAKYITKLINKNEIVYYSEFKVLD